MSDKHTAPAVPQEEGQAPQADDDLAGQLDDLSSDMAYEANQKGDQETYDRAALIEKGARALKAAQATQAVPDDVLKDAERYRFLEQQCRTGTYRGIISREAIDAAIAAQSKNGGAAGMGIDPRFAAACYGHDLKSQQPAQADKDKP